MDIAKIRKKIKAEGKRPVKADAAPDLGPVEKEDREAAAGVSGVLGAAGGVPAVEAAGAGGEAEKAEAAPEAAGAAAPSTGEPGEDAVEEVEAVIFRLGGEDYAFRVSDVEELLRPHRVTPVPMTDPYLIGVTSVRGRIVPVVDMERRLTGTSGKQRVGKSKILILRGPKGPLGVLVGAQMEFVSLSTRDMVSPPAHLERPGSEYIECVVDHGDRFVSVLDIEELLNFNTTWRPNEREA